MTEYVITGIAMAFCTYLVLWALVQVFKGD